MELHVRYTNIGSNMIFYALTSVALKPERIMQWFLQPTWGLEDNNVTIKHVSSL